MEDDKIGIQYERNEYIFRIIYLIRINIPSSEYIYIIMFFLKYIGLILFSISLNQWNNDIRTNIDDNNTIKLFSNNSYNRINLIIEKFLINGNNLNILKYNYQIICLIGFSFLLLYILIIIFGFFYMKNKYYNKTFTTSIEKKIKRINNNSHFEEILFKIIAYVFFLIAFFHQYIIEYYIFGFLGYILYLFRILDSNILLYKSNNNYFVNIEEHLKNLSINPIPMIIINFITIISVLVIFIIFMIINSTKTLFINNGFPLYGSSRYLFIKLIYFNCNCLYGIINTFNDTLKIKIIIIINVIFSIIILIDIILSFYKFSFYPNKLNYIFLFIDLFSLFNIVTEIILYFIDSKIIIDFYLIRLIIQLINSVIFGFLFIHKQKKNFFQLFSENLFSKVFKILNPNDIYYYIDTYIEYSENKEKNYIKLFKLIQNHILSCNKKECPESLLIPKSISYSKFSNIPTMAINESQKDNSYKNDNNNNNKDLINNNNMNYKNKFSIKNNNNFLEQKKILSKRSVKDLNKNLNLLSNTIENRKSNLKKN